MADYMIKHLLIFRNDEIFFDESENFCNIDSMVGKIQAMFRSYCLRKIVIKKLRMKLVLKKKTTVRDAVFTVLLYEKELLYIIYAINLTEIYRIEAVKTPDEGPELVLKTHIIKLFALGYSLISRHSISRYKPSRKPETLAIDFK